jgi:hypothetical protein
MLLSVTAGFLLQPPVRMLPWPFGSILNIMQAWKVLLIDEAFTTMLINSTTGIDPTSKAALLSAGGLLATTAAGAWMMIHSTRRHDSKWDKVFRNLHSIFQV